MPRRGVFNAIMAKEDYMNPEQKAVPVKLANSTTQDPDELVECPYDKAHRIRVSRFPMHLLKCRKNYVGREMFTCPFNARHLVPVPEARHHVASCPDKASIEKDIAQGYEINGSYCKGYTKVPNYNKEDDFYHEPTENWDEEIATDREREYWGPDGDAVDRGVHRNIPTPRGRGAPRAMGSTTHQQPEMRLPRQPAHASAKAQQHHQQLLHQEPQTSPPVSATETAPVLNKPVLNVAGLGRGQFKGRVMAANLWGAQPPPGMSQMQSVQPRPGGLAQSGLEAQPLQNGNMPSLTAEDFPALGGT